MCAELHYPNISYILSACADASLALPAHPEPPSVVLGWTCDDTGRPITCCGQEGTRGLQEDQVRQNGPGETQGG